MSVSRRAGRPHCGQSTAYHFEYGVDTNYASRTGGKQAGMGTSDVPASQAVSGLTAATTYHYRIVAESLAGPTNGTDMTFTTGGGAPPPAAPVPTTGQATAVGSTAATLTGTIDPMGVDTGYAFQYGPTTDYGTMTPLGAVTAAAGVSPVTADITGLLPSTTYHFRLAGNSAGGIVFGAAIPAWKSAGDRRARDSTIG